MKQKLKIGFLTCITCVFVLVVWAENSSKQEDLEKLYGGPVAVIPLEKKGPVIDGKLDDAAWKTAKQLDFSYLTGVRNRTGICWTYYNSPKWPKWKYGAEPVVKPLLSTWAKIAADKENFYAAFKCDFPGFGKLSTAKKTEQSVELYLDVGHLEESTYYQIIFDAAGKIIHSAAQAYDTTWEPQDIKSRTTHKEDHWILEVKIPFKELWHDPTLKTLPKLWGANFNRTADIKLDNIYYFDDMAWAQTKSIRAQIPRRFGHLYIEAGRTEPKKKTEPQRSLKGLDDKTEKEKQD